MVALCLLVLGKALYIQRAQGSYWKKLSDSLHEKFVPLNAERGTIYSSDGNMLSTSIPYFNIYIDFGADGLCEKNGKRFKENLDSLSYCLADLFKDQSAAGYKKELLEGFREKDRYLSLQSNISFEQYKTLRSFPLVRLGRNKSGFITEVVNKRLNPFGLLANRTIGLARENAQNVGLERTYDSLLKGENGSHLVRYIAAGTYIPVEGSEIEPENGKDILTTLDVNIQDIAENALLKMMIGNQCDHGTCIVMEVATGRIKAIANLGQQPDGSYWEDLNHAIRASEPGSTFKLATLISLLEDNKVTLDGNVNLEGGVWQVAKRTVYDSEKHGRTNVTIKQAFELSSNVGMAKLAWTHYARDPNQFIDHLRKLKLNQPTGVDLVGETQPIIKTPKSKTWSATTLPWMAFGYEVLVSPLQTLTLYNAVANRGRMMRPYLVDALVESGRVVKQNQPAVSIEKICSDETLQRVKECLEGVCTEGTGKEVFINSFYKVAGKTGTALVANGKLGYAQHIYQSSFAGYFPADNPKYSCIVVIKNKPFAKKFYGAKVAAPVFKEIADKLMSVQADSEKDFAIRPGGNALWKKDSAQYYYAGSARDMKKVMGALELDYSDSASKNEWGRLYAGKNLQPVLYKESVNKQLMPDLKGMGLKDALFLLESMNIKVAARGKGKVKQQSVEPGTAIAGIQNIKLELN